MKNTKIYFLFLGCVILSIMNLNAQQSKSLPRATPAPELTVAVNAFLDRLKQEEMDIHSLMIVKDGHVVSEQSMSEGAADKNHELFSVTKTFTSTAIGFAVAEGKLKETDKVISFFPEVKLSTTSPYLKECEVRHLLTMSSGIDKEVNRDVTPDADWIKLFLEEPMIHKPGTVFRYSSISSHMLAAILQKATGEKMSDYLDKRLLQPLGIDGYDWGSRDGVTLGGFGLFAKTEDMAKLGLFYLQKGKWNGEQLLPESWIDEATNSHIVRGELDDPNSDWEQGYGYQIWRCRHDIYRADGAYGQYIIVMPKQNAVIAITARLDNMQKEIDFVWDYLLPALK